MYGKKARMRELNAAEYDDREVDDALTREAFEHDSPYRVAIRAQHRAEIDAGGGAPARGLTRGLGIHGWSRLDPVLLAALATEAPLLLVGPHGTAKTLLVERLAGA